MTNPNYYEITAVVKTPNGIIDRRAPGDQSGPFMDTMSKHGAYGNAVKVKGRPDFCKMSFFTRGEDAANAAIEELRAIGFEPTKSKVTGRRLPYIEQYRYPGDPEELYVPRWEVNVAYDLIENDSPFDPNSHTRQTSAKINAICERHGGNPSYGETGFGVRQLGYEYTTEEAANKAVAELKAEGLKAYVYFMDEEEWRDMMGYPDKEEVAS